MSKPETRCPPVKAAWRKGYSAGLRGLEESANPHLEEGQKTEDVKGWSRLYATTWHTGWVDGVAAATDRGTLHDHQRARLIANEASPENDRAQDALDAAWREGGRGAQDH